MSGVMKILMVLFIATYSGLSHAATRQWCAKWLVHYCDSGYNEDYWADSGGVYWVYKPAAYSRAVLYNQNTGGSETKFLDANGCANFTTAVNTNYTFRIGSWLERATGRVVKVAWTGYGCGSSSYFWHSVNRSVGNPLPASPINVYATSSAPTRVVAVASWALYQANTRGYPSNTTTYIKVDDFDGTYYTPATNCIQIDTNYQLRESYAMDHSQFKFVIGHEIGHRLAKATNGPLGGQYTQDHDSDYCNCQWYDTDTSYCPVHCFQSWEYSGAAETEGWAHFYGSAIFNARSTNCYMGFSRPFWVLSGNPPTHYLRNYAPAGDEAGISCAAMPKWRNNNVNDCDDGPTEQSIEQDWLGFFWNLWTQGNYKYEVSEIMNVWAQTTPDNGVIGEIWDELEDTAYDQWYVSNRDKYELFVDTGENAGVDNNPN